MTEQGKVFFEGRLEQIINTVTDPLFVKDRSHRWVVLNDAFAKLMGHSREELLGKSDYEFLPREQADVFWEKDELVFNSEHENVNEEKITAADGVERWIVTKKTPFVSNGEKFLVGIIRDITERKVAEEKLRRSEQLLSTVFASLDDTVLLVDLETRRVLDCNQATERIFGYTREEVVNGDTRKLHVNEETFLAFGQRLRDACKSKALFVTDFHMRRKSGECFPAEISLKPVNHADGGVGFIVGVIRDISERKKADAARARLSQAVEQAAESIVITDISGRILYVNPAFERITGYSQAECLGKNPNVLRSGKHDPAFYENLWNTILKGDIWRGRFTNRRKDGTFFEEESIISPVRDDEGKIINFVAIKRDMTQQIETEQRLMQAQKMEAVGRLAGGVAHDFNNLLTSILGFAQMVLDETDPKTPTAEDVKEIIKAGERAAALTQQLLAFSRKQLIEPRVLDLPATIGDMENMLRRTIGEDIRLKFITSPGTWLVKMDPNQVGQILVNLMLNGRDAMPKGGSLEIELRNERVEKKGAFRNEQISPGEYVVLRVSDTGHGMTEEIQSHLFEPFFTTKPKGKGTGLGLATVYGIVKQNNGYITIQSEIDKGTTIQVYLPRENVLRDEGASLEKFCLLKGTGTILLVEDEDTVRTMAKRSLENRGYRVMECSSGEKALQIIKDANTTVDLLLTDVVMPEMSGPALAASIHKLRPEIKILFMSGYTNEMIAAHGVLEEGTNFIQKPFTANKLIGKVMEVLQMPRSG